MIGYGKMNISIKKLKHLQENYKNLHKQTGLSYWLGHELAIESLIYSHYEKSIKFQKREQEALKYLNQEK